MLTLEFDRQIRSISAASRYGAGGCDAAAVVRRDGNTLTSCFRGRVLASKLEKPCALDQARPRR